MEKKKVGFASGIGFILAAAGSAVGLGNLWGFPYKTSQNGGAAFVLIYIACVLLIGFVTMLSEIYLGRRSQANPMTAYKMVNKNLGWCGLVAIMIPAFIICYYSVLGGWTTKYALNSFSGNAGIVSTFSVNTGEVILYTALFLVLSVTIIMGGVKDGIEKASKVLMPVLFCILVAIAVYALTLGRGVREGLAFYLKPDFSGITFKSVLVAMGQAFYSLSLGMGIMITYGSYTGKEVNLVRSTAMVCVFDTVVALLAGLAIFPSVAHFDPSLLGSSKGVALMFIILPQVFESMGSVGQVVSFAFFVMVDIAAITSVVSLIEVVTQFVIQKFHVHRKRAALVVACVCFAVSIPIGISLGHVAILEESSPALFAHDVQQVALQQGQHHLGLGVSEAAVVLDDLGAVRGEHQAEVQAALEGAALGVHGPDGGQEDLFHALGGDLRGVVGVRGNGAHAAGVQAGVVVVGTLVVHAGHHGLDHLAVRKAQHTDLGAGEEFLHHHMVARCAEFLIQHDLLHAVRSLLLVFADQHALAQCQTVGLDDHRVLALGLDVLHDLGGVVKGLVLCGGDAVFLHQVLGEHLGSLDAGSGLVRAKGGDAHLCQRVHHAQCKGVVLRHHNVIELFFHCKAYHGIHIGGLDVFALGVIADTAVARCAPDLAAVGALFQCLDDGVLAAAAANHQNFFAHFYTFS